MPIKVYLSEANQGHNAAADGSTEKALMIPIVKALYRLLYADPRFAVKRCTFLGIDTARANVAAANAWGADRYVAIHSNAGGVGARGTICFHHSNSPKGKALAQGIYDAVAPLSPGTNDHGLVVKDAFIEVGGPNAPAVLVELEAHDWMTGCEFLHRYNRIARALYKGICRGVGLEPSIDVLDPKVTVAVTIRKSKLPALRTFVGARGGSVK